MVPSDTATKVATQKLQDCGCKSPFSFGSARSAASHAASWADTLNTAWPNTYRRCTKAAAAHKAASDTTVGSFSGTVRARACDQQCSIKWLSNRLAPNQYMVFGMACRNTLRADSLPSNRARICPKLSTSSSCCAVSSKFSGAPVCAGPHGAKQ